MLNFTLGALAGALMAVIATIAAVRQPEVQGRLGLVRDEPKLVAPRPTEPCVPSAGRAAAAGIVGDTEMLFSRQRFWSVVP